MFDDESSCCVELGSIVQRKENKKVFRIKNPRNRPIRVCRVDGGLISDQTTKRCDFLFLIDDEDPQKLALVEMKGGDHVHAIRQLISAAEKLNLKEIQITKLCFIVGAPAPKAATTYQNELLKQSKRFKALGLQFPTKANDLIQLLHP